MHTKLAIMMAALLVMSSFVVPLQMASAVVPPLSTNDVLPTSTDQEEFSLDAEWERSDKATQDDGTGTNDNTNVAKVTLFPAGSPQPNVSKDLIIRNFNFTGISGSINSITVTINKYADTTSFKDNYVELSLDKCVTKTSTTQLNTPWGTSTGSTVTYSRTLWNEAAGYFTPANIQSGSFSVCLSALNNANSGNGESGYVDYVSVTVNYTPDLVTGIASARATSASSIDDGNSDTIAWLNPTNAKLNDAITANFTSTANSQQSEVLYVGGFFNNTVDTMPNDATVNGVEVLVKYRATASNKMNIKNVFLTSDALDSTSSPQDKFLNNLGSSYTTHTFGSTTDKWPDCPSNGNCGASPTHPIQRSDIDQNPNFGVFLVGESRNTGSGTKLLVDYILAKVYYSTGGSPLNANSDDTKAFSYNSPTLTSSSIAWTSENYIKIYNDNQGAQVTLSKDKKSNILIAKSFGINIPTGNTVTGVEVTINRKASATNSIFDNLVSISNDGCDTLADNKAVITGGSKFWTTSYTNSTIYGADNDDWGFDGGSGLPVLNRSFVNNSDFSVCLSAQNSANASVIAYVDAIIVKVYYEVNRPAPILSATAISTGNVLLEWDISDDSDVTNYTIKRSSTIDGGYSTLESAFTCDVDIEDDCSYNDDTVSEGNDYFYIVKANRTPSNRSTDSNIASANTSSDKIGICSSDSISDCEPEPAPNGGSVQLETPEGDIQWFRSVATSSIPNAPSDITDWEFFEFRITGVTSSTVTLTMTFSEPIPANSKFYKVVGASIFDVTSDITSNNGDATVYFTITDNGPYDLDSDDGEIEDPLGVGAGGGGGTNTCAGDCYSPHLGVDQNGKVFYNDGLTINGQTFNVLNILHNSPDTIINLPVGEPVNFQIKAMDSWASQIDHCELGVAIPHGIFDKSQAAFQINVNRNFDGTQVTHDIVGDTTALKDLYVSFENIDDKTALCTISFVPTKHLQNDMFSVEVWDSFQYTGTYYFNHGIIFKGESLVGTPVYDVMDDKGRITTIAIADQTLEDLTHAVDTQGNKWTLVDGFWEKDFLAPDKTCDPNEGRSCIAFQDTIKQQQELAKKYFDGSKIQKDAPKSFTKDLYGHQTGRGPHESSDQMKWAMEITKALRFLK